ncbi:hypothetical protein H4O09_07720 [Stenotrophomonas sp. W1S232]|uniref:Uncharacterized protein n=1 Tax=Stenotrophomonas koreensis TaxID=266128 RepID=A0A7W3UZW6_9GAMM|nr:hypothetical protein [Stenotrophomonas koreensis]MBB1116933.1 hypothetical protein [Stenotrophomonas koreensis]
MERMIARIGWWLFALAALYTLVGTIGNRIASHSYIIPLTLEPGHSAQVNVLRLHPDYVDLELWHAYAQGQERPELGRYSHEERAQGYYVDDPGQPVILQVSTSTESVVYEAGPRTGRGAHTISRGMRPQAPDDDPKLFGGPTQPAPATLPRGRSTVTFSVLQVGPALRGERVELHLEPPLGVKSTSASYQWLWIFFFWPVIVAGLALWALGLAYMSWHVRDLPPRIPRSKPGRQEKPGVGR